MSQGFNRRALLSAGAAPLAGSMPLAGCASSAVTLCSDSPIVSDLYAPLTIDVHAHIFNGQDLQIKYNTQLVC